MLGIGLLVAIAVPFVLVVVFGFTDPVDAAAPATPAVATDTVVLSPVDGTVVPLTEVPDAAFADGSLGKGVAIRPTSGAVYAPFDGTVVAAFPTGHAVGLRGVDGVELLIHVGLDTVKLGGEHFTLKVQSGTEVKAGDLLVEFDGDAIEKAGYDLITPVIVTNGDLYPDVSDVASGPLSHGETLFRAISVDSLSTAR